MSHLSKLRFIIVCVNKVGILHFLRFLCQRVPFPAALAPLPGAESMSECKYLTQTLNGRQVQDRNYVTLLLRTNIDIISRCDRIKRWYFINIISFAILIQYFFRKNSTPSNYQQVCIEKGY